ncbi:pms1p [Saccharomyces arboricola H-6]|uniref:DNA mismatch repair protein PMS1 n=1 Tax=Saccharomyces arboricola (strain H-6 / AS 2.3317 / CBS 10644) TaxID=1160507 RepID=J8Q2T9_SACAR|nr:pms1p [Saccharomyces arboricola H-6]
MTQINQINDADVHRITSGQVITDLTTAVKELVDNSIDANANQIEITFKDYGLDCIECSDNGDGIDPLNYEFLALKHYTSKISKFQDVATVQTLGFRGEALSSLCAVAKLSVITTTLPPRADRLEYTMAGHVASKATTSRNKGTTIQISQLFHNLPVRQKEFAKTYKRQFAKCLTVLQGYAVINAGVKFSVWNITAKGKKNLILSTMKISNMRKNISSIFGANGMRGLEEVDLDLDLNPFKKRMLRKYNDDPDFLNLDYRIKVKGYMSQNSFGCGRNSKDRQFVFVNKRPVEYPTFLKCCNEVYKTFNNVQFPVVFLNLELPPSLIDVNVTPDKRIILLHNEQVVIDVFKANLTDYYNGQALSLPKRMCTQPEEQALKKHKIEFRSRTADDESMVHEASKNYHNDIGNDQSNLMRRENTLEEATSPSDKSRDTQITSIMDHNDASSINDPGSEYEVSVESPSLLNGDNSSSPTKKSSNSRADFGNVGTINFSNFSNPGLPNLSTANKTCDSKNIVEEPVYLDIDGKKFEEKAILSQDDGLVFVDDKSRHDSDKCCDHERHDSADTEQGNELDSAYAQFEPVEINVRAPLKHSDCPISRDNYRSLSDGLSHRKLEDEIIEFNLNTKGIGEIINDGKRIGNIISKRKSQSHKNIINNKEKLEDFEKGEKYLTLTVSKDDFKKMEVVGQFNLGFIIVTRKIGDKDDLFIVDQHASDEKYNFETLQAVTVFKSQKLIIPQPVDLSVIDELVVLDNLPVFEKNGFKLKIDEEEEFGSRIKLLSLPSSKQTLFDLDDFNELIHLIKEDGGLRRDNIRCSKIRSMFAMRACRSSIMIGKPLNKKTMTRVVHNLSGLDKPWNCPHGRPTMRHLTELCDWNSFLKDYKI